MNPYILPLSDPDASLEKVGGKGMSLARLINAGLPVPDGFHVTTAAYRQFVLANGLQEKILAALLPVDLARPETADHASVLICGFFEQAQTPMEIADAIRDAYIRLGAQASSPLQAGLLPVAVRSSATAEDLPEASFAGQLETYLNICGAESVLKAVRDCWASLWTGRAILYRMKKNLDQGSVALAVVVQALVTAEAAGILFTTDPSSGERDEMVINAAWGLGEAVVGGLVTPDTYTLLRQTGKVVRCQIAQKTSMTVRGETGTHEQPVPRRLRKRRVLEDAQAARLAQMGCRSRPYTACRWISSGPSQKASSSYCRPARSLPCRSRPLFGRLNPPARAPSWPAAALRSSCPIPSPPCSQLWAFQLRWMPP